MKKSSTKPSQLQLDLFNEASAVQHWESVRRVEIDGKTHYSILDIFKYYGSTTNYRQEWATTQKLLELQGFDTSSISGIQLHQFEGERQRPTPIADLETFLRIAQSTKFQHWESVRRFMSQAGAEKIESKLQKKQRETIEYMDSVDKGDTSGVVLLKAQYELNRGWDVLREEIFAKCESPQMGIIVNKEYLAVFSMTANELKKTLNTKTIRASLPLRQVQALTLAEGMLSDILAKQNSVTHEQIYEAIQLAIVPIGNYLRGISELMGVHHVTGKPLLGSGE